MVVDKFRLLALGTVGAAALGLAACGGGGGVESVDAEDWVADFCDLAVDFSGEVEDLSEDFADVDLTDNDAPDELVELFEQRKDILDDFEAEFDDIGKPDLDDGDEVRDETKAHFDDLRAEVDEYIEIAEDTDSGDDFEADFGDAASDVDSPSYTDRLEDIGDDGDEIIGLIEDESDECADILLS